SADHYTLKRRVRRKGKRCGFSPRLLHVSRGRFERGLSWHRCRSGGERVCHRPYELAELPHGRGNASNESRFLERRLHHQASAEWIEFDLFDLLRGDQ